MLILGILVFGLFIGWIAGILLGEGTRPNGRSLIAGLGGSFVGGLISSLIAGDGIQLKPSGLIGSLVGAIIILAVWAAVERSNAASASGGNSRSGDPRKR